MNQYLVLKTKQQAQNELAYSKPHITKPRFLFHSSRNEILNHSIWNHLISFREKMFLLDLHHPLNASDLVTTNRFC